jgi:hypothetical protein
MGTLSYYCIILAYSFLIYGFYNLLIRRERLSRYYLTLLLFFGFKMTFNYRKCTISYLEKKLSGKPKEETYLYNFLETMIDLRNSIHFKYFFLLSLLLIGIQYYLIISEE